jgi:hypothetical protein
MQEESTSGNVRLSDWLGGLIEAAKAEFGEPEYRYFNVFVLWCGGGRGKSEHHIVSTKTEISKQEYEAMEVESKKARTDAFMGRLKTSYHRVEREMVKDGWKEELLKIIGAA